MDDISKCHQLDFSGYYRLLEHYSVAACLVDAHSNILYVNNAFIRKNGCKKPRQSIPYDVILNLTSNPSLLPTPDVLTETINSNVLKKKILSKNLSTSWNIELLHSELKLHLLIESHENTSSKKMAQFCKETTGMIFPDNDLPIDYLQEIKKYYENIIARLPGNIYWKDMNGVFLGCNDQVVKIAGLNSRSEIIGKSDDELIWKDQASTIKKTDSRIMSSGIREDLEESFVLSEGKKVTVLTSKVPMYDDKKNIVGILGTSVDITDKKLIEATQVKSQAMRDLAGSVAHEMRNSLSVLDRRISHVKDYYNEIKKHNNHKGAEKKSLISSIEKELQSALNDVAFEVKVASTFMRMMLTNIDEAKINSQDFTKFSIRSCISEALKRYPFTSKQREKLFWDEDNDFVIHGSKELMVHVLFNLIKNALYYIEKAGKGEVKVSLFHGEKKNVLYFEDTGTGISKELLPHIFDSLHSSTPRGTGMGLYFCQLVINAFGGEIFCESDCGKYTRFILNFPVIQSSDHATTKGGV